MNKYKYNYIDRDEMNHSSQFNKLTVEESTTIEAGGPGGVVRNFFSQVNECIREIFG